MSRADIEKVAKAALEAAAKCCGKKHHPADIAELIRALDPAAIARGVDMAPGTCGHFCEACARRDDEIKRLRARVAELEDKYEPR